MRLANFVARTTALSLLACGGSSRAPAASSQPPPLAPSATPSSASKTSSRPTFADDVSLLKEHGEVIVLASASGAKVAVSAKYQGRVMTSGTSDDAPSLGFIHRAFIAEGRAGTPFDNYGGEDRFWLGPEGGQFGLYFPPGTPFEFDRWQTPHELQEGAWETSSRSATSVSFHKRMTVTNWSGTIFVVDVERTVNVLGREDTARALGVSIPEHLGVVAFESRNRIVNAGSEPWTRDRGLLSIWILGMYAPAADAQVIVPFENEVSGDGTPIVNDRYFGKVPSDRLRVNAAEGYLSFSCDGNHRSKIGIPPSRAKNVLGSHSASSRLLTLVQFDKPPGRQPYVNSMWEKQSDPFGGDVVNSYNDGSPGPGKPRLGGFYEIETSSPAAALRPGQSLAHAHRTFHIVGDLSDLDPIASKVLGVSLRRL